MLQMFYDDKNKYELCIDEVGRGCLFGRTYIACVILPKDDTFSIKDIKDSKKFSSKKKIKQVSDYIKEKALLWHVAYIDTDVIDEINILQAVIRGMHECIKKMIQKLCDLSLINDITNKQNDKNEVMAIIDGNYFKPYMWFDNKTESFYQIPHVTIEQGDAKYVGIAAASIIAKVARDEYVIELCNKNPKLSEYYGIEKNMGYGTKKHLEGIEKHGITQYHRKTFGICKITNVNTDIIVDEVDNNNDK